MPQEFYTSAEIRVLFGRPGKPLSYFGLRKLRAEGVGPLLGQRIKTPLPFQCANSRVYRYPKKRVDELLAQLHALAKTRL